MSSPNEPGYPAAGEGAGQGTGGAPRQAAHAAERSVPEPPRSATPPPLPSSTLDERLDRFANAVPPREAETAITPAVITGTAVTAKVPTTPARPEPARPDTYASELPDLSAPRTPPRRTAERESRSADSPASARPAARVRVSSRQQGPLRASMQVRRFDPWSVLKVSLVLSVAMFFVWMIAVAFLYLVLGGMGVWSKLNSNVGDLLTNGGGGGGELVSSGTIFGGAALIGLVNIVLMTAMATAAAFIYNLTTDLVGGIEVTLADRD
ncbi:hypothetical protein ABIA30_004746 [Mycobacterium sp. MAA66]|uniref:DUF3566 domain-containing protein n=1 Tax=Mycobacterium sp. MAA66 TaxID=3156297 RepID=UPI0035173992